MGMVTIGTLVLCLIIKPNPVNNTGDSAQSTTIQEKVPGKVKEIFKKKIIKDLKNDRLAIYEDKDMLVVETLDGDAEITIGANACKRIIDPSEYEQIKNKKNNSSTKTVVENKDSTKSEDSDIVKEKSSILNELDK